MQRLNLPNFASPVRAQLRILPVTLALAITGCFDRADTAHTTTTRGEFQGANLHFSCPDERLHSLVNPMARIWARQAGATVTLSGEKMKPDDGIDLAIIPFEELGEWADSERLYPLPSWLREPGHAFQYTSLHEVYRSEAYAGWGGQSFGLPIAVRDSLIVYRADRFADPAVQADYRKQFNRPLGAPASWEEFVEIAGFFAARDKRTSLPRLAADGARLESQFLRIAACYDRSARAGDGSNPESLAFLFRLDSGKPRINQVPFAEAGRRLADLQKAGCFPSEGPADIAVALNEGQAVMAVAGLDDLMKLDRAQCASGRYDLAPLPGTKATLNRSTGALAPSPVNYVPFFGGGWLGVVRKGCKNPDAAFALLAELAGPARSQEIIAAGGYGPTRDSHLESDRLPLWLGYGFDANRTRRLQDALRANLGKSVRNPAFALRTPDREFLERTLRAELPRVVSGEVAAEAGLTRVAAEWERGQLGVPLSKAMEWRRRAAGLN